MIRFKWLAPHIEQKMQQITEVVLTKFALSLHQQAGGLVKHGPPAGFCGWGARRSHWHGIVDDVICMVLAHARRTRPPA